MKTIGDYEVETTKCIGTGSFSKVYKCRHRKTKCTYAIKEIDIMRLKVEQPDPKSI